LPTNVTPIRTANDLMLVDMGSGDRSKLIGFHLPYPGVGVVERKGSAYRCVAAA
jgi:hypothetical protein